MIIQTDEDTIFKGKKTILAMEFCTLVNTFGVKKNLFTPKQIREFVEASLIENNDEASDKIAELIKEMNEEKDNSFETLLAKALENFINNKED